MAVPTLSRPHQQRREIACVIDAVLLSHAHKRRSIRRQAGPFENILMILDVTLSGLLKIATFGELSARINARRLEQPIVDDVPSNVCCDKRLCYQVRKRVDGV